MYAYVYMPTDICHILNNAFIHTDYFTSTQLHLIELISALQWLFNDHDHSSYRYQHENQYTNRKKNHLGFV